MTTPPAMTVERWKHQATTARRPGKERCPLASPQELTPPEVAVYDELIDSLASRINSRARPPHPAEPSKPTAGQSSTAVQSYGPVGSAERFEEGCDVVA